MKQKKPTYEIEAILLPLRKFMTKRIKTKDGVIHDLYSLGALAEATGRDTHTLRVWEKNGWIPKPIMSTSLKTDTRFYLKDEIRAYVWAIGICQLRSGVNVEKSGFPNTLRNELDKVREQFNKRISDNLAKAKE